MDKTITFGIPCYNSADYMMPFTVIDLAVQTLCDVLLAELSAGAEVLRHACVSP